MTNLMTIIEGTDCSLSTSYGSSSEVASIESEGHLHLIFVIISYSVIWCVCIAIHIQLDKNNFKEHCN